MKTKLFLSVFLILLLIAAGVLGYGYYRQRQELGSKNVQISQLEVKIRDLNSNIHELEDKNDSLQQDNKRLTDAVAAKENRIVQLEKFIAEKKLNVPKQISAKKSSSKDTAAEAKADAEDKNIALADTSDSDSSSLWCWIIFAVLLVMTAIIIMICKMRKKSDSKVHKNKKFICPSCGWEYRTSVAECENCKTKF